MAPDVCLGCGLVRFAAARSKTRRFTPGGITAKRRSSCTSDSVAVDTMRVLLKPLLTRAGDDRGPTGYAESFGEIRQVVVIVPVHLQQILRRHTSIICAPRVRRM